MISPYIDPLFPARPPETTPPPSKKPSPEEEKLYKDMKQVFDFMVSVKSTEKKPISVLTEELKERIQYGGSTGIIKLFKRLFFTIFKPSFDEHLFKKMIKAFTPLAQVGKESPKSPQAELLPSKETAYASAILEASESDSTSPKPTTLQRVRQLATKLLLEEFFSSSQAGFEQCKSSIESKKRELASELSLLQRQLQNAQGMVSKKPLNLDNLQKQYAALKATREKINSLKEELAQLHSQYEEFFHSFIRNLFSHLFPEIPDSQLPDPKDIFTSIDDKIYQYLPALYSQPLLNITETQQALKEELHSFTTTPIKVLEDYEKFMEKHAPSVQQP
jgi:DNA repair exonuclease SbcCD ATPase subunit